MAPHISTNLPNGSRLWRNLAHSAKAAISRFSLPHAQCTCTSMRAVFLYSPAAQFHTPTSYIEGRHAVLTGVSPAFFGKADGSVLARRAFAKNLSKNMPAGADRDQEHRSRFCKHVTGPLISECVGITCSTPNKGNDSWLTNLSFLPLLRRWASRPVVIPLANVLLSAAQLVRVQAQSLAAALSPVQRLAQAQTCFIASSTPANANALTQFASENLTLRNRRRASVHGGVLRSMTQPSEAICSPSF